LEIAFPQPWLGCCRLGVDLYAIWDIGHNNGPCCDHAYHNDCTTTKWVELDFAPWPFANNHFFKDLSTI